MSSGYFLGADTGGTFTDFVVLDTASGEILTFKVPSVPDDPAKAVRRGLERLTERHGIAPGAITRFIFGTTVATNAVLERRGARTALVATRGTRDVLEIQRQWRHRLFDLALTKPEPLVPRRWRLEARERIAADGAVIEALTAAEAERVAAAVAALGVEAVAVCLIFGFLDPGHERRIGAAIRARAPSLHVSLSSEVCPEFREYERSCTTAMNAYVSPKIDRLAARLEDVLRDTGSPAGLRIVQSNGGLMSAERARSHAVHTLLSGPAAGVVGAVEVAKLAGLADLVTMDMGGTSLDICLVQGGRVGLSPEGRLGGLPVKVPQIDIHTIGAGGGSIARLDRGALKVGPESAGADPGPVCYGRGGAAPTSTDCALALGLIDPGYFLGGEIALDLERARAAIDEAIARPMGLEVAEAAAAVVEVQVANMVSGIRAVSVQRGLDPREFVLLPFGGAGALYAGLVAEELGMTRILVPVHPGVLSALGMLMTDIKYTRTMTRLVAAEAIDDAALAALYRELEAPLAADMAADGVTPEEITIERSCDMRYRGQAYEVNVALPGGGGAAPDLGVLVRGFHDAHRRLYGAASEDEAVELVNFRVLGIGAVQKARLGALPEGGPERASAPKSRRPVHFGRGRGALITPVFERAALAAGARISGPAIVEEPAATTVLMPGHEAAVDAYGNLLITVPRR
ncbi:MAG: hydantoinase/oxoprolinase family protein [Alphaproteobacteria bacterium]